MEKQPKWAVQTAPKIQNTVSPGEPMERSLGPAAGILVDYPCGAERVRALCARAVGDVARVTAVVRFDDKTKAERTGASDKQARSPLLFDSAQTGKAPPNGSSH